MDRSIDKLAQRLAELLKENRNPPSTASRIGVVVETSPLTVQWGENVLLTETRLYIPRVFLQGYSIPYQWQDTDGNMIDAETVFKIPLEVGDALIIAPDEHMKMWFIIDKLQ